MGYVHFIGEAVSNADCGNKIEAQQREVGYVFIVERLVFEMSVNEAKPPERASAERIHIERRNEDAVGIPDDNMGYATLACDEYPDLSADLFGDGSQIAAKLVRNDCIGRYAATIDLLEQVEGVLLES